MEIFNHTFVERHIIGCSPVKKIPMPIDQKLFDADTHEYYYLFELYTTGGLHEFKSEIFFVFPNTEMKDFEAFKIKVNGEKSAISVSEYNKITSNREKYQTQNINVNIWKEAADRYINFIESMNPSDYSLSDMNPHNG